MAIQRTERAFESRFRRQLAQWHRGHPLPGVLLCGVLAWLAFELRDLPWPPFTLAGGQHPLSPVLLALLLGMALRNLVPATAGLKPGADFVIRRVLLLGIVLLGASLDFHDLVRIGLGVLAGVVVLIVLVVLLARSLAPRLGLGRKLALLLGLGTAICGTSAIVAAAPVLECEEREVAVSVATVNLLGVTAMLAFPALAAVLALSPEIYGLWCGLAIHATPQVLAAGFAHPGDGQTAGEVATIVKLVRISMLGPAVLVVGALYARHRRRETAYVGRRVDYKGLVPGFLLLFLLAAFLRTTGFLPDVTFHMTDRFLFGEGDRTWNLAQLASGAATWLITAAMAAVGLMTQLRSLAVGGARPFGLGLACSLVLAVLGLAYAAV